MRSPAVTPDLLNISVFATPLGYWALVGQGKVVFGLTLGQPNPESAQTAFGMQFGEIPIATEPTDWHPQLRQKLERYSAGERISFKEVKIHSPERTPFQQRIIELTRQVPYGQTVSYGQLAAQADYPRAARAVGTVMRTNRIPIIVPCHRIVGSTGLGGYSAPQGLTLKERLLMLERE